MRPATFHTAIEAGHLTKENAVFTGPHFDGVIWKSGRPMMEQV
jgi:hypothetical protein